MWLCIHPRLEFNIEVGEILKNKRLHRYKYLCSKCKSCNFSIHLSYTLIRVKKNVILITPHEIAVYVHRAVESNIYTNGCYRFWTVSTVLGSVTLKVFLQSLTKKFLNVWIPKHMTSIKYVLYFLQCEWNSVPMSLDSTSHWVTGK